jgi:hypothetical protein
VFSPRATRRATDVPGIVVCSLLDDKMRAVKKPTSHGRKR